MDVTKEILIWSLDEEESASNTELAYICPVSMVFMINLQLNAGS